ncbi:MAG: hypothetical protein ABWJ42_05350 [Sulfolobales archaeon]
MDLLRRDVAVIADWDADGVVSSAVILYAQRYESVYPLKRKSDIEFYPSEPLGGFKILDKISCYESVVFLDLPLISVSEEYMRRYKSKCEDSKIIFIDHHLSSHKNLNTLAKYVDEPLIGYNPTSKIAYDKVLSEGAKSNERLEKFVSTIFYMDQGYRVPRDLRNIMKLLASISKYMTFKKDRDTWIRIVEWMAPRVIPPFVDSEVFSRINNIAEEIDREMRALATEIAVSAQRIGIFRYVDVRRRWRRKGASSLASNLYRIFKSPVAVLVRDSKNQDILLLVIKYPGKAYRVAEIMEREKLIESIGGHPSLAIIRFYESNLNRILDLLRRVRV